LLLPPVPPHCIFRCCLSPRDEPSRSKATQGEKQCAPTQLCPGLGKLVPSPRQGVRGDGDRSQQPPGKWLPQSGGRASPGTARAVVWMVYYAKAPYPVAKKPAAEPCWQCAPARGIIVTLKKRQKNSIAKYIVPVTVTEVTLGLARLQSSC